MIDLLIAAALLQATADPCNAAGQPQTPRPGCPAWRLVTRADDGNGYLDPASLHREGQIVELTSRILLAQEMEGGAGSIVARVRLDCARRTSMILLVTGYDSAGVRQFEGTPSGQAPRVAAAGSGFASMLDEFCPH